MSADYRKEAWQRIKAEFQVLLFHWRPVLLCGILLGYVVLIVLRNLAYWRNRVVDRDYVLPDLGFELFEPALRNKWLAAPDYLTAVQIALGASLILICLFRHPESRRQSAADICLHYAYVLTILQVARAGTYLVTSLPDPQTICAGNSTVYDPPTLPQVFYRYSDNVCGDLIFSGHTLATMDVVMLVLWYSPRLVSPKAAWFYRIAVVALEIAILPLLLAARRHYSVDVLVSIYITPLLFYFVGKKIKASPGWGTVAPRAQSYVKVPDPNNLNTTTLTFAVEEA